MDLDYLKVLSFIAGVLFIGAYIPYFIAIFRGQTKPAIVTWFIWATLDAIVVVGMYKKDALNGQMTGAVIGAVSVAVLSLWYGKMTGKWMDIFCVTGAVLGIVLWKTYDDPVVGMITSLSTIFLATTPTFLSVWHNPADEDRTAWTIFLASCVVSVIAIPKWTMADAAPPITFFVIDGIVVVMLYSRPRKEATK